MKTDTLTMYRCFHCSGRGEVPYHYPADNGRIVLNWQRCRHCDGTGQYVAEPDDQTIDAPARREAAQ